MAPVPSSHGMGVPPLEGRSHARGLTRAANPEPRGSFLSHEGWTGGLAAAGMAMRSRSSCGAQSVEAMAGSWAVDPLVIAPPTSDIRSA